MACDSFRGVQQIYVTAKQMLGEILSGNLKHCTLGNVIVILIACEFFDDICANLTLKHLSLTNPLSAAQFYCLVETSGSNDRHDQEVSNQYGPQ